jgi:hypothetical protein
MEQSVAWREAVFPRLYLVVTEPRWRVMQRTRDGQLVSRVGVVRRLILAGEPLRDVGGVGYVGARPEWRRRRRVRDGLGRAATLVRDGLGHAATLVRDAHPTPFVWGGKRAARCQRARVRRCAPGGVRFGLLGCRPEVVPAYAACGWTTVPGPLADDRPTGRIDHAGGAMVLRLGRQAWRVWRAGRLAPQGLLW